MHLPRRCLVLVTALLGACAYRVTEEAGATVFRFDSVTRALCVAIPAANIVVGIALIAFTKKWRIAGIVALPLPMLFVVAVLPGILMDRVVLNGEGVFQTTGFWWSPTVKGFRFVEITRIDVELERQTWRNGKERSQNVWLLHQRDGELRRLDPGDLWENAAAPILKRCRAAGIDTQ